LSELHLALNSFYIFYSSLEDDALRFSRDTRKAIRVN